MNRSVHRSALALCAASLLIVGCGSASSTTDAGADASAPQDVVTARDVVSSPDAASSPDAVSSPDAAVAQDVVTPPADVPAGTDAASPADGGAFPAMPAVVPTSAMGHDRLFGVVWDNAARFYAAGVVADSTDAMADVRTQVRRFLADGSPDMTWGTMGVATRNLATGTNGEVTRGIVVQRSGKVVVLATVEHAGAMDARDRDIALARFNPDGTPDSTFGTNGVVTLDLSDGVLDGTTYVADTAWGLAAYPDDRLVVTGARKRDGATDTDFAVVRLTADGARDATFGTNGVASVDVNNRSASPRTASVLADGSIVMAGYMTDGGVVKPVLFKLTNAGQLDTTFGTGGIYTETVLAVATEAYAARLQGTSFVTAGYGRATSMESIDWLSLRISATGTRDLTYGNMGVTRLDRMGFADNARDLVILPDNRVMMVGGGRSTETDSDGMIAVLTANGQLDTTWGTMGRRVFDFGGASDFFWAV
ncbi:MAG: hypothetical protein U0325_34405, partial [Polyangiales bacterium]